MVPYKSKDYVIKGSYLVLDKEQAWKKIEKRMRTAVRKAEKFNPKVFEVSGNKEDLRLFSEFCPFPETLPREIKENQKMFFASIDNKVLAGLILTEIEGNLFLEFNAVRDEARDKQLSSYLIWQMVEIFSHSEYKFLDIGTSYRASLKKYFDGWKTDEYPIIMNPPKIKPSININPFVNSSLSLELGREETVDNILKKRWTCGEYTFFPDFNYALFSLLKWLAAENCKTKKNKVVFYFSLGDDYEKSERFLEHLDKNFSIGDEINKETAAVVVSHEYGFPLLKINEIRNKCDQYKIPLVEDCSALWESGAAGEFGDYVLFSFPNVFPMQFGALLVGKKFDSKYIWDNFACYDETKESIVKKQLATLLELNNIKNNYETRLNNFKYLSSALGRHRVFLFPKDGVVPNVFLFKTTDKKRALEIVAYVSKFGVECFQLNNSNVIALPSHQNLDSAQLEYMAGAVLAMYRNGCGVYNLS